MKKNVLIVDDSDLNLYIYKRFLSSLSPACELLTTDCGTKALDIISQRKIDLILTDICMPGMSGYELIKIIRSTEEVFNEDRRIKIIILSAYCDRGSQLPLWDEQILIPVEKNVLIDRVEENLGLPLTQIL